jgi:serine/threonine protein kinase
MTLSPSVASAPAVRPTPTPQHIDPEIVGMLAPPQSADEIGRLGGYRVLQVLGVGGMGVVFQAEDVQLRRPVALKCLLPSLNANVACRRRFLQEAQAAAKIQHDHIITVYQVGEDRNVPFLAMQLLQGETLEARLQRVKPLAVAAVFRLGREIAEGLDAAHASGLIHRDIKPSNIWLEAGRDRVKILDFGLARVAGGDTHLTASGVLIGTPAYMAPEQARGGQGVGPQSDLFSLGCVLYRLCTGELPFKGADTLATLTALAMVEPPRVNLLNPEAPPTLADLIARMLAKDPTGRPPSARAVVDAIDAIVKRSSPSVAAQPALGDGLIEVSDDSSALTVLEPDPRLTRRRTVVTAACDVLILVLLVTGIALLIRVIAGG